MKIDFTNVHTERHVVRLMASLAPDTEWAAGGQPVAFLKKELLRSSSRATPRWRC